MKITSYDYSQTIIPQYTILENRIISNTNLNLIEKSRILCAYTKYCQILLKSDKVPELIITDELSDTNPYKIATEEYKKIIDSLKEPSGFF